MDWLGIKGSLGSPLTSLDEEINAASLSVPSNNEQWRKRDREREIEIGRGGNVMTLLKIVLLTNWWVSAAF